MANIISLRPSDDAPADLPALLDLPTMLRRLADNLERGAHGLDEAREAFGDDIVARAAVVLRISGQRPAVFGFGPTSVAQTYMDLCAGAQELMNMEHPERT